MLIAVLGCKSSGKDTFANYIIDKYQFTKYSFADPLKKGIQAFFNLTDAQLYDEKLKEEIDPRWGVSPRKLFQTIGTDIFQYSIKNYLPELITSNNNSRNHWVLLFREWYNDLKKNNQNNVVIADARFLHEVEEIKQLGGIVIKIIRPEIKSNDFHKSEMEINEIPEQFIDYIIINDSDLNSFYNKINELIKNNKE
jgi:hypothetical protein